MLDFAKKKRISREKRNWGVLGGLAGLFFSESKRGAFSFVFVGSPSFSCSRGGKSLRRGAAVLRLFA